LNTVLGIVVGLAGLGFLVLVHELGHFVVAKATGMRVEEFSLGFGPYLIKRRWGETVYGISAVPIGGYVRVTGMHKEEFEERIADLREIEAEEAARRAATSVERAAADVTPDTVVKGAERRRERRRPRDPEDALTGKRALTAEEIASTPLNRRYYSHPLWHKLLFIVAGVVMNAIAAYALLYVVGLVDGENVATAVVGSVTPGSGAAQAGIEKGDRIVSIAGEQISDWDALRWVVIKHKGDSVAIVVERSGQIIALPDKATVGQDKGGLGLLGISWGGDIVPHDLGVGGSFGYAARQFGSVVKYTFDGIGLMFTRDVPVVGSSGVAGVIGIVQISGKMVSEGATVYLYFVALISINLALLNMLPLLPLDGGHFVYAIVERVRRRPVSLKVFTRISMVGFALIGLLFLLAMYNDIGRLFTGLPQ
jgi:regulator of sigma E protease